MIPLKDTNPGVSFPIITLILICINVSVFVFLMIPAQNINQFILSYALYPSNIRKIYSTGFSALTLHDLIRFITHMFMHGSWMHLIGNCWFLWIFGNNVEGVMGKIRYLFFYLLFGISASLVHVYVTNSPNIPTIGASGAIAGVMGAYLILFPKARILTFVPLLFIWIIKIPAFIFLIIWFGFQLLNGLTDLVNMGKDLNNVAFWAHIGGFVTGFVIGIFFRGRMKELYRYYNNY